MNTNREEGKKDNTHEKKDAIYLNMFFFFFDKKNWGGGGNWFLYLGVTIVAPYPLGPEGTGEP